MRISDDPVDALERGDFFRRALRVAARDHDARRRIRAMNFAHRFARLRIRGRRDGAGVQHHKIGARHARRKREPAREEFAAQRGGIRFRGAASKIFDRKGGHVVRVTCDLREVRRNYSSA